MKDKCEKNKKNKPGFQDAARTAPEMSMVAVSGKSEVESGQEIVMVSENEEQLCLLIEEAGLQAVIDSACSKTVAGIRFIVGFLNALPAEMKNLIDDAEPSSTVFQFGGGDQRISSYKMHLPAQIGCGCEVTGDVVTGLLTDQLVVFSLRRCFSFARLDAVVRRLATCSQVG